MFIATLKMLQYNLLLSSPTLTTYYLYINQEKLSTAQVDSTVLKDSQEAC